MESIPRILPQKAILPSPEPISIKFVNPNCFAFNANAYADSNHVG